MPNSSQKIRILKLFRTKKLIRWQTLRGKTIVLGEILVENLNRGIVNEF